MEKYRCPDKDCAFLGDDWLSLKKHVKEVHNKFLWYEYLIILTF